MTQDQIMPEDIDFDELLADYEPPDPYSPKPVPLTTEQRMEIQIRCMPKRLRTFRATMRRRKKLKEKLIREMEDYSEESRTFNDPARPEDRINPYNYGNRPMSRHSEPQDITPAAEEFKGVVDLFDPTLFPAQNSKKYSDKSGREFLADFTKATRGQLVVSMARIAQENPKEFTRLWIEMEKFNTPQQSAVDVNADVKLKAGLYAKLDEMSGPVDGETVDLPPEPAHEVDENGNDILPEADYELPNENLDEDEDDIDTDNENSEYEEDNEECCPCTDIEYCRHNCPMYNAELEDCSDPYPNPSLFPNRINENSEEVEDESVHDVE